MEDYSNNDEILNERDEIFSKVVRAGKRTYFFDVKATRNNDYYLTVTESKKRFDKEGGFHYEKHKIFLYKEDFEKFADGLSETVDKIRTLLGGIQCERIAEEAPKPDAVYESDSLEAKSFIDLEFEDLEK
jgi:hypothetical protein